MKLLQVFCLSVLVCATGNTKSESSPTEKYTMDSLRVSKLLIEVKVVDDINAVCQAVFAKKNKTLTFIVDGCSDWTFKEEGPNTCTIYVEHLTNNDILGHEMHHCLVGNFHQ